MDKYVEDVVIITEVIMKMNLWKVLSVNVLDKRMVVKVFHLNQLLNIYDIYNIEFVKFL